MCGVNTFLQSELIRCRKHFQNISFKKFSRRRPVQVPTRTLTRRLGSQMMKYIVISVSQRYLIHDLRIEHRL